MQHAHNPVNWFPWGKEAFQKAEEEDKPIFLSIGYATCHWCHEMEKDSFENEDLAHILNQNYVSIKVDREERPDIDGLYMRVCQAFTGSGGWPLTIIMTPDKKPFFAGTFFFADDRYTNPGLKTVLIRLNRLWKTERKKLLDNAQSVVDALKRDKVSEKSGDIGMNEIQKASEILLQKHDNKNGGFSKTGPKFPQSQILSLLMRYFEDKNDSEIAKAVQITLDKMAKGGIYDHIGGGFHRYSVDAKWLVPHFEKMLYDQALLARTYAEAYQVFDNQEYLETAKGIFDYAIRDLSGNEGAFYSAEDADSEGVEGKFYIWDKSEIENILGKKEAEIFCKYYGISEKGNFEGRNILNIDTSFKELSDEYALSEEKFNEIMENCIEKLFNFRKKRNRPLLDDKIITSWNGLMIAALAYASPIMDDKEKYIASARKAARFILEKSYDNGILYRRFRGGEAQIPGFLDDYAFFIHGLIELYEADLDYKWLKKAIELCDIMLEKFGNKENSLSYSGKDNEKLFADTSDISDGAIPAATSIASFVLYKIAGYTEDRSYSDIADGIIKTIGKKLQDYPHAFTQMLCAIHFDISPELQITIVEYDKRNISLFFEFYRKFLPNRQIAYISPDTSSKENIIPWLIERDAPGFYICKDHTCHAPAHNSIELQQIFDHIL